MICVIWYQHIRESYNHSTRTKELPPCFNQQLFIKSGIRNQTTTKETTKCSTLDPRYFNKSNNDKNISINVNKKRTSRCGQEHNKRDFKHEYCFL